MRAILVQGKWRSVLDRELFKYATHWAQQRPHLGVQLIIEDQDNGQNDDDKMVCI